MSVFSVSDIYLGSKSPTHGMMLLDRLCKSAALFNGLSRFFSERSNVFPY